MLNRWSSQSDPAGERTNGKIIVSKTSQVKNIIYFILHSTKSKHKNLRLYPRGVSGPKVSYQFFHGLIIQLKIQSFYPVLTD